MNPADPDLTRNIMEPPLVVAKLGGSLLACTDLAERLRTLLATLQWCRILIVVGGGPAADVVRDWSQRHSLSEDAAHWLAIQSLSLTRGLVQDLLPECEVTESPVNARELWRTRRVPLLLNLEACLRRAEFDDPSPLPHTWGVTSDSIAAWIASRWKARELILIKSIPLPAGKTLESASQAGIVDDHFPIIGRQVSRINWCHLLAGSPCIQTWRCESVNAR